MNEEELKVAIEYYKMGKANERLIIYNSLQALDYQQLDELNEIRNAMDNLRIKEG